MNIEMHVTSRALQMPIYGVYGAINISLSVASMGNAT